MTEHNPLLYERARDMAGHIAQAMKQASRGIILLCAPVLDRHLEAKGPSSPTKVFCFYDMQGAGLRQGRSISEELASQTTWEAFS
jgi:hypothetical protein